MKGQKRGRTVAGAAAQGVVGNGGNGKMGGSIHVGGVYMHISGANIFEYLSDPCPDSEGKVVETPCADTEISLKLSEGKGEPRAVEFHSWIDLSTGDVEISTGEDMDGKFDGWLSVFFKDKDGKKLQLIFSCEQARIVAGILSDFVEAQDLRTKLGNSQIGMRARE